MKTFGLIGFPLGHSFSESYFRDKFMKEGITGAVYKNYPLSSLSGFPELIRDDPSLRGLNVTIPYKKAVIPFLTSLDPDAEDVGAVNVIKIHRSDDNILLKGYNTDIFGFRTSLLRHISGEVRSALVLGTGGSSAAVVWVLRKLRIDFKFVSRTRQEKCLVYEELDKDIISSCRLIINTTPLGMYPETERKPPIPYHALTPHHILYDLIYNPEKTSFLKEGSKAGCLTVNGLEMLKLQAEKSWEIWNDPAF